MTGGNGVGGASANVSAATALSQAAAMTIGGTATLLIAVIGIQGATLSATSVALTWNGVAMTPGPSQTDAPNAIYCGIFYKINPATGSQTLAATWTNAGDCEMSCISFIGTDTSTGIKTADNATKTSAVDPADISVTSATGDATVAMLLNKNGAASTVNFTKIFAEAPLNPGSAASYQLGGTSNDHTFTGGAGVSQVMTGVHVLAGGAVDVLMGQAVF